MSLFNFQGSNIYVKNIDTSVGDEELRDHFSACGKVLSAKVMRDDKGASKGFGFVCFSTVMEACKSMSCFNGELSCFESVSQQGDRLERFGPVSFFAWIFISSTMKFEKMLTMMFP